MVTGSQALPFQLFGGDYRSVGGFRSVPGFGTLPLSVAAFRNGHRGSNRASGVHESLEFRTSPDRIQVPIRFEQIETNSLLQRDREQPECLLAIVGVLLRGQG